MKEQPYDISHAQSNYKKRLQIPQKLVYNKFYVYKKNWRTRNCRWKFIKKLLPEKRRENMSTKQPQFKSQLNNPVEIKHLLYTKVNE